MFNAFSSESFCVYKLLNTESEFPSKKPIGISLWSAILKSIRSGSGLVEFLSKSSFLVFKKGLARASKIFIERYPF